MLLFFSIFKEITSAINSPRRIILDRALFEYNKSLSSSRERAARGVGGVGQIVRDIYQDKNVKSWVACHKI